MLRINKILPLFLLFMVLTTISSSIAAENYNYYQKAINQEDVYVDDYAAAFKDNKFGFVDKNNKFVVEPKYTYAQNAPGDYFFVCKDSEGNKCAYMNKKTHKLLTGFKYIGGGNGDISEGFSEGLAKVVVMSKNNKWLTGYINKQGKEVIKPKYISGSSFKNGIAEVRISEKFPIETIKIDKTGKEIK